MENSVDEELEELHLRHRKEKKELQGSRTSLTVVKVHYFNISPINIRFLRDSQIASFEKVGI